MLRSVIIEKLNKMLGTERTKLATAQGNKNANKIDLHQAKIDGLLKVINKLTKDDPTLPLLFR